MTVVQDSAGMRTRRFECMQCGQCCLNLTDSFATCATEADVRRWAAAGRKDILANEGGTHVVSDVP